MRRFRVVLVVACVVGLEITLVVAVCLHLSLWVFQPGEKIERDVALQRKCVFAWAKSVTVVTHSTVENVFFLESLVRVWSGPIVTTVFLRDERDCERMRRILLNVSEKVLCQTSFLFKGSKWVDTGVLRTGGAGVLCERGGRNFNSDVIYPANLLRNVGVRAVSTEFVLVLDADVMPSEGLFERFRTVGYDNERVAFVLPAFEMDVGDVCEEWRVPGGKEELMRMVRSGKVRPFYREVNARCQQATNYPKWYRMKSEGVRGVYEVEWVDPFEPFFIVRKENVPMYDERFVAYGVNRLSQICEMHMAEYRFVVLDEAFVVHVGFKEVRGFHVKRDRELRENQELYRRFKMELLVRYNTSSRYC